jgi:hypothetical protein
MSCPSPICQYQLIKQQGAGKTDTWIWVLQTTLAARRDYSLIAHFGGNDYVTLGPITVGDSVLLPPHPISTVQSLVSSVVLTYSTRSLPTSDTFATTSSGSLPEETNSAAPPSPGQEASTQAGLSTAAKAGIGVGTVIGALIIGLGAFCLGRSAWKKTKNTLPEHDATPYVYGGKPEIDKSTTRRYRSLMVRKLSGRPMNTPSCMGLLRLRQHHHYHRSTQWTERLHRRPTIIRPKVHVLQCRPRQYSRCQRTKKPERHLLLSVDQKTPA